MKRTIEINLLKYSAGLHIFCPICDKVADYREWVIVEKGNSTRCMCAQCFDHATEGHDMSGCEITRYKAKAKPKAPTIYKTKLDRKNYAKFPQVGMPMLPIVTNDDGGWSSKDSTLRYVQQYELINHLRPTC